MQKLLGHHKNLQDFDIQVDYWIEDQVFHLNAVYNGPLNTSKKFSREGFKNWGLWEFDVLEIFLSRHNSEYLELQVSPLGQKFALIIERPREIFHEYTPKSFDCHVECVKNKTVWELTLDISDIPGDGKEIKGNIHACLGPKHQRGFMGLNLNPEERADFHRPEFFIHLGELSE